MEFTLALEFTFSSQHIYANSNVLKSVALSHKYVLKSVAP